MEGETRSAAEERDRQVEQEIAGWMRVGYRRDQLIVKDGFVIPDTDKVTMDLMLEGWAEQARLNQADRPG